MLERLEPGNVQQISLRTPGRRSLLATGAAPCFAPRRHCVASLGAWMRNGGSDAGGGGWAGRWATSNCKLQRRVTVTLPASMQSRSMEKAVDRNCQLHRVPLRQLHFRFGRRPKVCLRTPRMQCVGTSVRRIVRALSSSLCICSGIRPIRRIRVRSSVLELGAEASNAAHERSSRTQFTSWKRPSRHLASTHRRRAATHALPDSRLAVTLGAWMRARCRTTGAPRSGVATPGCRRR